MLYDYIWWTRRAYSDMVLRYSKAQRSGSWGVVLGSDEEDVQIGSSTRLESCLERGLILAIVAGSEV